jgi:hypothetical protein
MTMSWCPCLAIAVSIGGCVSGRQCGEESTIELGFGVGALWLRMEPGIVNVEG